MYFEADAVIDDESEYFLARTPSGLLVVLSYYDPFYREIRDMVGRALKTRDRRREIDRYALDDALSAALDPAPNGEQYRVDRPPPCPNGHDPDEYVLPERRADPPFTTNPALDRADHAAWDALSPKEREQQVERIVAHSIVRQPERKQREDERLRRYRELQASEQGFEQDS